MPDNTEMPTRFSKLGERAEPPIISDLMNQALENPNLLSLAAGFTDNITLPHELIEICVKSLREKSKGQEHLQYGTSQGRSKLREETLRVVQSHPNENIDYLSSEQVMITNGSQQALYLCMQVLCDPGDIVFVQKPSYFVLLEMLKGLGINAVSIPDDENGDIDFERFDELINGLKKSGDIKKLKAIYLVNYFANPSSRCMSLEQKRLLGDFIQNRINEIPVLEDAAYREIYFDKPWETPSILSLKEYQSLPCLYFGTFTKPFATGLKVGFCISNNKSITDKMLCLKGHQDFGTANFNQAIVESMLKQGLYDAHLSSIRIHYKEKADIMDRAMTGTELRKSGWNWDKPEGGLLLWLKGPSHCDTSMTSELCKKSIKNGVLYVPGDLCFAERRPLNYIRLAFGSAREDIIKEAISRFADVACNLD